MNDAVCKEWRVLREADGGKGVLFYCAGCDRVHSIHVDTGEPGRGWTWNGDVLKPTFNPSVLVTHPQGKNPARICHSFVRDGYIQYLGDSTHRLANNTVPLLAYEHWFNQDA